MGGFREFENVGEALRDMRARIGFSPVEIKEKSWILKEYGRQKRLSEF